MTQKFDDCGKPITSKAPAKMTRAEIMKAGNRAASKHEARAIKIAQRNQAKGLFSS